jgi:DNA-binding NtrC family response regulator
LSAIVLEIPPLRERVEDIPALAETLARAHPSSVKVSRAQLSLLSGYRWPGNVRELQNFIERLVTLGPAKVVPELFGPGGEVSGFFNERERTLRAFERSYLAALLEEHRGVVADAARAAGVGRSYLYRMLDQHGIKPRSG